MSPFSCAGPAGRLTGQVAGTAKRNGDPVVLVHGINMSSDVWREVAKQLSQTRQVVAFDLRGHGGSDRSGPYTAQDYAADTLAVMDHLDLRRAHVVGASYGGSVACVLAAQQPARVTSLTAIGSAARVDGVDIDAAIQALQAVGVRDFFAGLLPQASFAPGVDPALIERALVAADRDPDTVIAVTRTALTADHTDDASAVTCPALVITGELDQTTPVPLGAELAKLLNTEHVVVDNRGHVLPMEDPTALVALLAKHFDAAEHR